MTKMSFSNTSKLSISIIIIVIFASFSAFALNVAVVKGDTSIKIMPLGDSITVGLPMVDPVGYRQKLYLDLTNAGFSVVFVGNQSDGGSDHEGHGGWGAEQIRDNVYAFLEANPADIVLLHIGTNDISGENENVTEVEGILNSIDQYEIDHNENVTVILARIILRTDNGAKNETTKAFNNEVEDMARARIANGDDIIIVDMENALTYPDDMADSLHPNAVGYEKMADVWYDAVSERIAHPPVTFDDYNGLWHTTDFAITLNATDEVAETYYKINDGPTKNVSADGQPFITTESANNTLEYWSVDNTDNEELPHKIRTEIKLDKTAPSGSIVINNDDAYATSTFVTLTLTATDATSGVYQVRYSDDGTWDTEVWETSLSTKTWNLTSGDGTKTVYYQIRDNASLVSITYSDPIILDTVPPTGSITINDNATFTTTTSVTLTLSATDETSDIAEMRFSNDNISYSEWQAYDISKSWILQEGDGTKTVYVQFRDNASLSSFYSDSIILDTTKPIANAGVNQTVNADTLVTFNASTSQDENGIQSYNWTFTDATPQNLTGKNPTYTFATPETYTITLKVTDPAGNYATDTVTITVLDITKPTAKAGSDQIVNEGTLVTFNASQSTDNVGITQYTWTFDDETPQTLNGINPTYNFTTPSTYIVTLAVNDAAGNYATDTVTITVLDITKPIAKAGSDQTINEDTLVSFDASGSSDDVGIVSYKWTFTDAGTLQTLDEINPTYTFQTPGTYTVTLNVTDTAGNYATDTVTIIVLDITKPTANAGDDVTVHENTRVTFNGSDSTDNVGIVSYVWTFIDITPQTLLDVNSTYIFDIPSIYNVTLTVSDAQGNLATDVVTITVIDASWPAANAGPDQIVNEDSLVTLNGSGSFDNVGITSYIWTFIDGALQTMFGVNPSYTFETPAVYTVTLNVSDAEEHYTTDNVTVTVLDITPPIVDAGSYTAVVASAPVNFDASGSSDNVGIVSYKWDFGDGAVENSSIPSVIYTYTNPRVYMVRLTAIDEAGNMNTSTISVVVSRDTDGDLIADHIDTDDDNDEIPDDWEILYGLNPLDPSDATLDFDGDSLSNLSEYQIGSDPNVYTNIVHAKVVG